MVHETVNVLSQTAPSTEVAARSIDLRKVYGEGDAEVPRSTASPSTSRPASSPRSWARPAPGKSTLMHCLAALDTVTTGEVIIGDTTLTGLNDKAADGAAPRPGRLRLPGLQPGAHADGAREHPAAAGDRRPRARPGSGSTRHRHRRPRRPALATSPTSCPADSSSAWRAPGHWSAGPAIVFADEPTGNLDSTSGAEVLGFLRRSVDEFDQTIVMVTHDPVAAAYTDRVVFLADGKVVDELREPTADAVLEKMKVLSVREVAGTAAERR